MSSSSNKSKDRSEPIAVVGMSCRFPGGINSPQDFWEFICNKKSGISDVPEDRWNLKKFFHPQKGKRGKSYVAKGGFLENIDKFDADFFRISPREAAGMDPQQRILLELTWEACEDGGLIPGDLSFGNTGVYIGLFVQDYTINLYKERDPKRFNIYSGTGTSPGVTAGRISHYYNLKGPSLVIDTACSSSLVATHYGCNDLLSGDADVAIVGGINLALIPEMYIVLCQANMLSPDGYCKAFDAEANGYVRSEGGGIVILKRLSDAIRDKNQVYATIIGSSVNHDGRGEGLTVPNRSSQEAVIRSALAKANISSGAIQYVETHGTGTEVGDPIEASALGSVYCQDRSISDRLVIGGVKTNIGHTESAAGVAGLIKTVLMLKHRNILPNLHFNTPNPKIDFDALCLEVPVSLKAWDQKNSQPRIAGVNSFGFGGTNAHAILQEFTHESPLASYSIDDQKSDSYTVPISASTRFGLNQVCGDLATHISDGVLQDEAARLQDIASSLALNRTHHKCRIAFSVSSKAELVETLNNCRSRNDTALFEIPDNSNTWKTAFVFSGMGQQWRGMGKKLYTSKPVCREAIDQCNEYFRRLTDKWSVAEELQKEDADSKINETQIAQPAIFTLQVAMFRYWESCGIIPDCIIGHSVGEIAAYYCAGALSLEDAVRISFHRSRLQHRLEGSGTMLAIGMNEAQAQELTSHYEGEFDIGVINGPNSVVLSGESDALKLIALELDAQDVFNRFLSVQVPYHSSFMDGILDELFDTLRDIQPRSTCTYIISSVTGLPISGEQLEAGYWQDNVRKPVRFKDGIFHLKNAGYNCFIEISAHSVLSPAIHDCLEDLKSQKLIVPSLKKDDFAAQTLSQTLCQLYSSGFSINWSDIYRDAEYRFVSLPTYPWQQKSYWSESDSSKNHRTEKPLHPFLTRKHKSIHPTWKLDLILQDFDYLKDHGVFESVVFPAAAIVEMMLAAADDGNAKTVLTLRKIIIKNPLILTDDSQANLQLVAEEPDSLVLYCQQSGEANKWRQKATSIMTELNKPIEGLDISTEQFQKAAERCFSAKEFYDSTLKKSYQYGVAFQLVEAAWQNKSAVLAKIAKSGKHDKDENYYIHPVVLDACFQPLTLFAESKTFLPVSIESFVYFNNGAEVSWSYLNLRKSTHSTLLCDITILDSDLATIALIKGLECKSSEHSAVSAQQNYEDCLYSYEWFLSPVEGEEKASSPSCITYSPEPLGKYLDDYLVSIKNDAERTIYFERVVPELNRLCSEYIIESLTRLGWHFETPFPYDLNELAKDLNIAPNLWPFFKQLISILKNSGLKIGAHKASNTSVDPQKTWNAILDNFPVMLSELLLINRCGANLQSILMGEKDALETVFLQQSSAIEHLYQDSPSIRVHHELVQNTLGKLLESYSKLDHLRILELGAGTGGLTTYVLPMLPAENISYCYTDISAAFLPSAKEKFKDYNFVDFNVLDLNKQVFEQGHSPNSFDLILASNVLHTTADLKNSLSSIKSLLKTNGVLIFVELTKPSPVIDLVFGPLKGWWTFTDKDTRPEYPLLSKQKWLELLDRNGFEDCIALEDDHQDSFQTVFVSKKNESIEVSNKKSPAKSKSNLQQSRNLSNKSYSIWYDSHGIGEEIIKLFRQLDITPSSIKIGDSYQTLSDNSFSIRLNNPGDTRNLIRSGLPQELTPAIIYLWNLDLSELARNPEEAHASLNDHSLQILQIVRALMSKKWIAPPELFLLTQDVHKSTNNSALGLWYSPFWGLKRTIQNEYPTLGIKIIDIGKSPTNVEIENCFSEIINNRDEDEVIFRGNSRYINRLKRTANPIQSSFWDKSYALFNRGNRQQPSFVFQETPRRKPGPGEIEIEVKSVAMNFKDVATVLGLIPDDELSDEPQLSIGYECSGIVTKSGDHTNGYKTGDSVYGIGWGCYSKHSILNVNHISLKPTQLSFSEAATIPIAYLTAYHALVELAHIQPGENVLIHTAAGGVGQAAIKIAKAFGATIFTTAGSQEKRLFLEASGVAYVGDSRSLEFADEIREKTNGVGIDIVLNTLPGEAIEKSLSLLKSFSGRFIDISNFFNESDLAIRHLRRGISVFGFDLEMMSKNQPEKIKSILDKINRGIRDEEYHPLPFRAFNSKMFPEAFNYLRKANQIGKILISMDENQKAIPGISSIPVRPDRTYLIAGGYSGFGFSTAKQLVDSGAKHLVLVGRTGKPESHIEEEINLIRKTGVSVEVQAIDLANAAEMKDLFESILQNHLPLGGIIHSAMVMHINLIMNLNEVQFREMMFPKVLGAWYLHQFSKGSSLDFFVLYSSVTSVIGFPGQSAYSAGNYFLNQLATFRRTQNLPATSICWGTIGEAGYLERNTKSRDTVVRQGFSSLPLSDAWKTIRVALENDMSDFVFAPIKWADSAKYMTSIAKSPRFSFLRSEVHAAQGNQSGDLQATTKADHKTKDHQSIKESLCSQIALSLDMPLEKIKAEQTFEQLNFDSLLAVELGVKIFEMFKIDLPKLTILQPGLTITTLADIIKKEIDKAESDPKSQVVVDEFVQTLPEDINLLDETILPEDIKPGFFNVEEGNQIHKVLLTGATGFLGAYLLKELLDSSEAVIHCLVRSSDSDTGKERILKNLERYGLLSHDKAFNDRIVPLVGDLTKERLGISKEKWTCLAKEIDVIYHSAAHLNFVMPYSSLKPVNVNGTVELIRLASISRSKPLHYVSSMAKLAQTNADPAQIADAGTTVNLKSAYDEDYIRRNSFNIGYHQSKWVADELVLEASLKGLPAIIYRPSLISGDSRSGHWNTNDYICQLIKGCILIGAAPLQDALFDFCPVDYVARAIVHLSGMTEHFGKGFIIKNPKPITWNDFVTWFIGKGYQMDLIAPKDWLEKMNSHIRLNRDNPLFALSPLFEIRPMDRLIVASPTWIKSLDLLERNTTRKLLKNSGIEFPEVDNKLLEIYLSYFKQIEFL